jgi:hypothetical protein
MGIIFPKPSYDPQAAFDYLIHDTPNAKKQDKYLYPISERISTIDDLTSEEKIDENAELYIDLMDLLNGQITWHDLIKKKPKRIHMISNISRAYDLLFYETYGRRYFDIGNQLKPQKHEQPKPTQQKPLPPKLIPITDPKELDDDMPF